VGEETSPAESAVPVSVTVPLIVGDELVHVPLLVGEPVVPCRYPPLPFSS